MTELQDAFRPSLNPNFHAITEPTSIRDILIKQGVLDKQGARLSAFVVSVDGDYKLEKDWDLLVGPSNLMVTIALPPHLQGGGGGSNPLRLVLMVAVMAASFYIPGAIGLTGAWASAASAGIMIGGSMLINALLPQPKISAENTGAQAKQAYFIGPQGNQARSGEPIATLYGRRRIYPDLIIQPYVEMSGNEVYLHQVFCLTQGKINVEQICIEKTPIQNFEEVEYKIYQPNEKMDLFPDNVYSAQEVSDLTLEGSEDGDKHIVGYRETISSKAIDDKYGRHPNHSSWLPTYEVSKKYSEIRSNINFKGGYVATPLQSETDTLSIDIYLPRGLAYMNDQGNPTSRSVNFIAQARLIDESNNPAGGWFSLTKETTNIPVDSIVISDFPVKSSSKDVVDAGIWIKGATIDPIMQTYTFKVAKGRYEVRIGRGNKSDSSTRVSDELHWIGLRSYMPNKLYYGNVTLLAVKMRSSNNLNNNIARRLNVLATRILPVWNGNKWVEQPTRSIAWAVADMLRNTEYGRGLKDSRMNLRELIRLDKLWYGRSDFFDGYFTEQLTIWEALTRALEVGRTKPIYVAGVIDFVRNEPRVAPTQMFTPENIVQDSFQTEYAFPKTGEADHIIVEYTDPISWQSADMVCALPESKMLKPMRISMPAITNPQQAWREGIHRAAMHHVQREFPSWSTELEGLAVSYGNEVLVAYDEPEWGLTGRIIDFDGNVIHTSNELDWTGNNIIALRAANGGVLGSYKIEPLSSTSGIIPDLPLDSSGQPDLSDGSYYEPTHYIFGNTNRVGKKLVITSVVPGADNQVALGGVVYDDFPHRVEHELEMPVVVPPHDPVEEVLAVTWIKVKKSIQRNIFEVTCNQARGAVNYEFEVAPRIGANWTALYKSETPIYTGGLPFGNQVMIRARAIGSYVGEWFVWTGEVNEEDAEITRTMPGLKVDIRGINPVFADITITGIDLNMPTNYYIEQDGIVIWTGVLLSNQSAITTKQFDLVFDEDGEVITQQVQFKAYAVDSIGNRSEENIVNMIY